MKKFLSAILSAMIICSVTGCSTGIDNSMIEPEQNENTSSYDEVASDDGASAAETDVSSDCEDDDLPSAVDLRDYNGKNYVTPVKRQAFGDCWSFGICAAAESSYLYANDLGVPAGVDNTNVNFSERYLSWYVYHSITEDDVKLGKVRSSQVGEGYDLADAEEKNPNVAFIMGGASLSGANVFASGFGPVDENTEVNGVFPYAYSDYNKVNIEDYEDYSQSGDWSIPLNAEYRNPPVSALLRNGYVLPSPASKDSEGNYKYDEDAVITIKSEIAKGHAVAVTALVFGRMNYENWAAYSTVDQRNHVVTIVGYDDNYPKENFAVTTPEGETEEGSIPPTDGAFIIKDSYGESGGFDAKGSFYISYHDHTFLDPISFDFDEPDSVKYNNLNYDQYDLMLIGWCAKADHDSETKTANVFDAEEDEYLTQITYKTKMLNTSVHYEIYKDIQDGSPDSGTLLEEGDSTHSYGGSHKIDLKNEYELKKGEKYSIVLTMTYTTEEGASTYTEVIPYAANAVPYGMARTFEVTANCVVNKGESYLFSGGKWADLADVKGEYPKLAYEQHSEKNLPEGFMPESADGFAIDNYPIKAILVPANEHK